MHRINVQLVTWKEVFRGIISLTFCYKKNVHKINIRIFLRKSFNFVYSKKENGNRDEIIRN